MRIIASNNLVILLYEVLWTRGVFLWY